MYILVDGKVWDPDLALFGEIAALLDRHLDALELEWRDNPSAESLGYYDRGEYLMGLGFAACQSYLTSTYGFAGVEKPAALAVGPRHSSGYYLAQIINHAANYWKHKEEWPLQKNTAQQKSVADAFVALGSSVDDSYPLSCVLAVVTNPPPGSFASFVPQLATWRDHVRMIAPKER